MNNQSQLLMKIDELSLALTDTLEFLNTHPDDAAALAYYHEVLANYKNLHEAFSKQFFPLTITEVPRGNVFAWTMAPNPWEMEAN